MGNFVALFTADARVNEGSGAAFIRRDYADFFSRVPDRRLEIQPMTWTPPSDGRLQGKAHANVAIKSRGDPDWRHLSGALEIELIATPSGVKIKTMLYRLRPE